MTALLAAQKELPVVGKNAANPFFKSKYADLAAIWRAVKDILHNHGLVVTNTLAKRDGEVVITTYLIHAESGQSIMSEFTDKKCNTPQETGSAASYGRRYNLSALLGLVIDGEDDDGEAAMGRGKAKAEPKPERKESTPPPAANADDVVALLADVKTKEDLDAAWAKVRRKTLPATLDAFKKKRAELGA